DKLYATAADGLCQRNGMPNYTGFMAVEGLFVLASWDQGADQTQMFASMRSVTKIPTGGGSATNLLACCRRLSANAASMPPPQNGFALQAAAACEAAARNNNAGGVNSSLAKFGMSCK
ncbi:MAG: hypothetical protein FWD57_09455, partial [Polyangiaceae bacterium]|nr:hypothetical protein [Polyangiaceae bacterium]